MTYDGTQHTVVFDGNSCVDDAATKYLVDLTLPAPEPPADRLAGPDLREQLGLAGGVGERGRDGVARQRRQRRLVETERLAHGRQLSSR